MNRMSGMLIGAAFAAALTQGAYADAASGFAEAWQTFVPGGDATLEAVTQASIDMIPQLTGSWTVASLLFLDGNYNAELAETACERITFDIAPTGKFGFTITRNAEGRDGSVVTYAVAGASTFARTADIDSLVATLFGSAADTVELSTLLSLLRNPVNSGHAQVHLVDPDVLVIETAGAPPEILTRCSDG